MKIKVVRGDAWVECAALKAASVPLIVTDPPYGKILSADWDKKWNIEDYEVLAYTIERLLVPGGTAYVWGGIGTPKHRLFFDITELFKGKIHSAEKPSRLAEIMIETSSKKGELVLDMFAGSGSTGVAAKKLGRSCLLIEKSNCKMHEGFR